MCNAASERTVEQLAVKEREPDKPPMWNKSCQCDIDLERQKIVEGPSRAVARRNDAGRSYSLTSMTALLIPRIQLGRGVDT